MKTFQNNKKMFNITLIMIGIFVVFSYGLGNVSAANPSSIYVSTQGNNSWNGLNSTYIGGLNGPKATIKNATATVGNGGTVYIANGLYRGVNNTGIVLNTNMTIQGVNSADTVINATGDNWIFNIPVGTNITINNLQLTNGNTSEGGAINVAGILNANNCVFTDNYASTFGGAIYGGNDTIINCSFINNTANDGGAISDNNYFNDLNVSSSVFLNNNAELGGAFSVVCTTTINYCSFVGNNGQLDSSNLYSESSYLNDDDNWWNSNAGPLNTTNGIVNNWLVLSIIANPSTIKLNQSSEVTADLLYDNDGNLVNGTLPEKIPLNFNTTLGSIVTSSFLINGSTQSILNGGLTTGDATVSATLDNQTVSTIVNIKNVPLVETSNPTRNAINIPPNQVIKITFNEPIEAGNMDITLQNSKGITTPITTSISGNILTINHKSPLTNGICALILHTGSITDINGNLLALYGMSFTVDSIPPTLKTITPIKNALKVPVNQVIKITFSEPIKAGNMDIEIKTSTGKEIKFTKTISGNTLILKPTSLLSKGTKYLIILHTGCVTDIAANNLAIYGSDFTTI